MSFYAQRAAVLRPVSIAGDYGGEQLSYDEADGATRTPIPFGVDIQPRSEVEIGDGGRVMTQTGWTLHTPPGRDLDVTEIDQIVYNNRALSVVGEVHRWPSADYPSGVDHVEISLEYRSG
jgi:hypothetical protein